MSVTAPMKLMTLRIPPDEKSRLEALARDNDVTLSHALREGAKLFLQGVGSGEMSYEQTEIPVAS